MTEKRKNFMTLPLVLLVLIIVVSRVISVFYSSTATNIAFAGWFPTLLSHVNEIISVFRIALVYSAIVYAVYKRIDYKKTLLCISVLTAVDFAARYLIDLSNGSITGSEVIALIWVMLQMFYELVFIVLSAGVGVMMFGRFEKSEERRQKAKYLPEKAVTYAILLYTISRIFSEIIYLVDFLRTYTNITPAEIASIIGSFISIILIYGALPLVFAQIIKPIFRR